MNSEFHVKVRAWTQIHFPNFKKGSCSDCFRTGDTATHHLRYVIPHTSDDIVELCHDCHAARHANDRKIANSPLAQSWMLALSEELARKRTKNLVPNIAERQGVVV